VRCTHWEFEKYRSQTCWSFQQKSVTPGRVHAVVGNNSIFNKNLCICKMFCAMLWSIVKELKCESFGPDYAFACTMKILYIKRSVIYIWIHRIYTYVHTRTRGPGSSVGIATDYGLDDPGIESHWGRDFSHTSALWPTQLPVQWVPSLSRG
jgi:hypothetical protein